MPPPPCELVQTRRMLLQSQIFCTGSNGTATKISESPRWPYRSRYAHSVFFDRSSCPGPLSARHVFQYYRVSQRCRFLLDSYQFFPRVLLFRQRLPRHLSSPPPLQGAPNSSLGLFAGSAHERPSRILGSFLRHRTYQCCPFAEMLQLFLTEVVEARAQPAARVDEETLDGVWQRVGQGGSNG
eukprot:870496-Rhodomonas_salina.5